MYILLSSWYDSGFVFTYKYIQPVLHAGFYPSKLKRSTQRVKAALWERKTLSLDDLWKSMEWNIINSAIMNKAFVFRLLCNNYMLSVICLFYAWIRQIEIKWLWRCSYSVNIFHWCVFVCVILCYIHHAVIHHFCSFSLNEQSSDSRLAKNNIQSSLNRQKDKKD